MNLIHHVHHYQILLLLTIFWSLEAISVRPTKCPTNKIAPQRRGRAMRNHGRTFGYFFQLFENEQLGGTGAGDLQERPQEDTEPEDCGHIDDYDEHDLTTASASSLRSGKFFFGWNQGNQPNGNWPPFFPANNQRPPAPVPLKPQPPVLSVVTPRPRPSHRPPYASGGIFANNQYQPPHHQQPSDSVKPVHEHSPDVEAQTWRPTIVGGPTGHVTGAVPARPICTPSTPGDRNRPFYPCRVEIPEQTTTTRKQKCLTCRPQAAHRGVIGSYLNLFLK